MVKVYELTRFDGMQLKVNHCGVSVTVEFKGGDATHRARFMTNNPFVQDALEGDLRFGKLFVLKKQYKDEKTAIVKEATKEKRKITSVKTVNQALRTLSEMGYNPTGEGDLDSLMEKAGVEFPNLKR